MKIILKLLFCWICFVLNLCCCVVEFDFVCSFYFVKLGIVWCYC